MKPPFIDRKIAFKLSLLINFLCLIYIGNLLYKMKDHLMQVIINRLYSSQVTDSQLMEFHKQAKIPIEGKFGNEGARELKLLILGNSLSEGMAASDKEHDYVHLLLKNISTSRNLRVNYKISSLYNFERNFKIFNYQSIQNLIAFEPEIIVFQLGENVQSNSENIKEFVPYYVQLVSKFPASKKIITTPFFPSKDKNDAVLEVATRTGANLVDLSHLTLLDARNFAHSERSYNNAGEGSHPGDYGMENIEHLIFCSINSVLDR